MGRPRRTNVKPETVAKARQEAERFVAAAKAVEQGAKANPMLAGHAGRRPGCLVAPTMSEPLSVTIDGIPPSPNEMRRAHWHTRSDQAESWRWTAKWVGIDAINRLGWTAPKRASVELVAVCATHLRRDPDNFVAACKPIIDGLVDAGVLSDDSFAVVASLSVRQEFASKRAAVRVTVTPLP